MNLLSIRGFISELQGVCDSNAYLTYEQGGYKKVALKPSKNLNSEAIAKTGAQAVDSLKKMHLHNLEKVALLRELAKGLKDYSARVWKQKSTLCKWASLLYPMTHTERTLRKTANTCESLATTLSHQMAQLRSYHTTKSSMFDTYDVEDELSLIYYATLDSSSFALPCLENGLVDHYVVGWMCNELLAYKEHQHANKKPIDSSFDVMLGEMQKLYSAAVITCLVSDAIKEKQAAPFYRRWNCNTYIESAVNEILAGVHALKSGEEYAMSGGYAAGNRGHFALYLFKRINEYAFSFTIINTGTGASANPFEMASDPEIFAQFGIEMTDYSDIQRESDTVTDSVWAPIPNEAINDSFIEMLLNPMVDASKISNIGVVRQKITEHLKNYPEATLQAGHTHNKQKKGSCVVKAITSWVHNRMKTELSHDFKAFYTQRLAQKLDENLLEVGFPEFIKQRFRAEVDITSKRRMAKLKSVQMSGAGPALGIIQQNGPIFSHSRHA